MKLHQLAAIIIKDLRLFLKNRASVVLTVVVPVVIASFFGFLTSPKSSSSGGRGRMDLWVADGDGSAISKEIIAKLSEDPALRVSTHTEAEARRAVTDGKVSVAVVLPPGFGEKAGSSFFAPGGKPAVTLLVDPSRSIESGLAQGLLSQHAIAVISRHAFSPLTGGAWIDQSMSELEKSPEAAGNTALRELLGSVRRWMEQEKGRATEGGAANPVGEGLSAPFETTTVPTTGGKGAAYNGYAHSFGGMALQFILMFGIECAVALLMDRRSGIWRRLRAAPVSRATVLTGRALSCALISFLTLSVCWLVAMLVFGVRVHGSGTGFILVNAGAALLAASFALMLASIGRSVEATRGIAIFAVLMLVMLGGAWMPTFIFPEWLQNVTAWIPTRWAVDSMDAMTWRGLPLSAISTPLLSLAGCIVLFGLIAWWQFRWQGE
jgi:ABC-2 type transport system permease protein